MFVFDLGKTLLMFLRFLKTKTMREKNFQLPTTKYNMQVKFIRNICILYILVKRKTKPGKLGEKNCRHFQIPWNDAATTIKNPIGAPKVLDKLFEGFWAKSCEIF